MEVDKKKKKNKKKNKQATKQTECATVDAMESISDDQSYVSEMGPDNNSQILEIQVSQNDLGPKIDVDMDKSFANGAEGTTLAEAEEQYWLDREASLQEKVKQLQTQKDASIHKEAILEEKIEQLLKERDENLQKEASQEDKITKLRNEKDACMQKEDSLEEEIEQLLKDKDAYMQKEADLVRKILQLESEKDLWLKKKVGFEEKINQLENEVAILNLKGVSLDERIKHMEKEKDSRVQKQDSLEEEIEQLLKDKDAYMQKEADLVRKILQLESEKDLWLKKKVGFEEKINQLENEVAILNLKGVSLDERIKHMEKEKDSRVQKQNSTEEAIATLENDNTKLRAEMMKLEESRRRSLLQENHLLSENISSLQSQINKLESSAAFSHFSMEKNVLTSENGDADYQIEAARPLIENLITENAELVEKVSELYSELEERGAKMELSSFVDSDPMDVIPQSPNVADTSALVMDPTVGTAYSTDSTSEAVKMTFVSRESTESFEDVLIKEAHVDAKDGNAHANSSYLESDEIVQIPLDESEVMDASDLETGENDKKIGVPLSEAPLIGAPFRLISFVARYVSGADLVDQKSGSSAL
ncbi:myosin heavy chain, clone 203-like isoform X3 [Olea europaea var. sylvestris]|uniref:myosin heavy chain, clone 203-like isoform X3 n=1 Tax=Olea europaea var. sylvestris TaxID=158386 RepID=UPI000C1D06CA|nr:myosin heavy chain, clone 203-like isoform X3 [Olea europaea var. sylvestris]